METIKIDIVNPKAKKIIKVLADLDLITIRGKTLSNLFKPFSTTLEPKAKKSHWKKSRKK
jgi:hypothetical protein